MQRVIIRAKTITEPVPEPVVPPFVAPSAQPDEEPVGDPCTGWTVTVRAVDPDTRAETDVVPPYAMSAINVTGRLVPCTPPERTPAATDPHTTLCTGDIQAIGDLLDRLAARRTENDDVARYGRWLFECLLAPAWAAITALPAVSGDRSVELALRWDVESDLHQLIWESMHDGRATLAGHPNLLVAVSRLVPGPHPQVATITGIPRVLFAAGARLADPVIRPGAMYMGLLRSLDANGQCRARAVQAVSIEDLQHECARFVPDVVHLVAHGVLLTDGRAALMLRDGTGQREADSGALITALSGGGLPTAVVLSACSTGTPTEASPLAARLVAAGIPVVSAMAGQVSEPACRLYTRRLATAVHEGLPVVEASAHGRRAALLSSPQASAEIDWALPALFLAEGMDPWQKLVDGTEARRLIGLADRLDLRREPVFIGRDDIIAAADRLVEPDNRVGVLAVLAEGSSSLLGGTRLLREIGWRLLRAGHVPLLLGPYAQGAAPQLIRHLITAVLQQALVVTEKMELAPWVPDMLKADDAAADALSQAIATLSAPLARARIRGCLASFKGRPADMDLHTARDLLGADLAHLAEQAGGWGPPFGPHSRAVLLCDDVHEWSRPTALGAAEPVSALDGLLGMIDRDGLGRPERPAPVVLTGSKTAGAGQSLSAWSGGAKPWQRVYRLAELEGREALLGYQWVLLHPWTTKPEPDLPLFGRVYTSAASTFASWERGLASVPLAPTNVEERLYLVADVLQTVGIGRRDDDEEAWRRYADSLPGGQQ